MNAMRTFASHSLTHMGVGFFLMGGWAIFANKDFPMADRLLAGLVQGLFSGGLTLLMKRALEVLSSKLGSGARSFKALLVPPFLVCAVSGSLLVVTHKLAGTPALWATVAFPFTVSFLYACLYTMSLWQKLPLKGHLND